MGADQRDGGRDQGQGAGGLLGKARAAVGGGLRAQLKSGVRRVIDRLSGEHSAAAPETLQGYARPGVPREDAEVVMAKLHRPAGSDGS
ncbi:MAG: hypothetical protein JNM72_06550 [Deltaproteobacteria bacterium]|nr:hypothetical protein [Deltaproteobacteria bacterium]